MSKRKNNRLGKAGITFYTYATERIREKRLAGKHNTADLYRTTRNWICAFLGRRNLFFPEITPGLISRFVAYLQSAGLRVNTVNTYLSNFRSIYNQACRDGLLPACVVSPFAYLNLKRERAGSRALGNESLREIVTLKSEEPDLACVIDYCTFAYLSCGMPFADMARLTTANLYGEEIVYRRKKTGTLIRVGITAGMRRLINKYADASSPYLFPILLSIIIILFPNFNQTISVLYYPQKILRNKERLFPCKKYFMFPTTRNIFPPSALPLHKFLLTTQHLLSLKLHRAFTMKN